ncbi:hypothetical protein [Galbibacter orientalis]|uniref:Uncharacterized protein n=1 Tax=Galbibacter orientalis DSM 19592 TaxID=926559 RepID=I3C510_9FLAO|nr:hypothetical protein [Galbibacter orientalis]EIJ38703.1 hypothetical protein JoomaDRAFT_1694 [Galbibacter orientalis DSM 19592]
MLRIYPILFTLLYMLAMLKPVLPVFDYVVNQDYIAEYLCINKDKPEMHCDGKCYLMQMLEEQRNEKKQNLPSIDLREYPIGFVTVLTLENTTFSPSDLKNTNNYTNKYSFLNSYQYFHPPIFS